MLGELHKHYARVQLPQRLCIVLPIPREKRTACLRFWAGCSQSLFRQLIIATESSSHASQPDSVVNSVKDVYAKDLCMHGIDTKNLLIAPSIRPLGKSYTDKAVRSTPAQCRERLRAAAQGTSPYVWIYGHGSSWEKDGPYGKGDVDPQFEQFIQVVHQFKQTCH